jgi:glucokinase
MKGVLAYEIGGTNAKATAVNLDDSNFTIDNVICEPTVVGKDKGLEYIQQLARIGDNALKFTNIKKSDLVGIGIGSPGPLNVNLGTVTPTNSEIGEVQIVEPLSSYFNVETILGNDVGTAALGSRDYGIGKGKDKPNIVVITSGTGLGGGCIDKGKLIEGTDGNAYEIGHFVIDYSTDARHDACTKKNPTAKGHWEAYCSGTHFAKWVVDEMMKKDVIELIPLMDSVNKKPMTINNLDNLNAKHVFDMYEKKDPFCLNMVENFRQMHARGLGIVISTADPDYIILMGSMHIKSESAMLHEGPDGEKSQNYLAKLALEYCHPDFKFKPENLMITPLGDKIGLYGAVVLGKEAANKK